VAQKQPAPHHKKLHSGTKQCHSRKHNAAAESAMLRHIKQQECTMSRQKITKTTTTTKTSTPPRPPKPNRLIVFFLKKSLRKKHNNQQGQNDRQYATVVSNAAQVDCSFFHPHGHGTANDTTDARSRNAAAHRFLLRNKERWRRMLRRVISCRGTKKLTAAR